MGPSLLQRLRATTDAAGRARPARPRGCGAGSPRELALTDRRRAMEAGLSLARFDARAWIGEVDVPHAVVVTTTRCRRRARPASAA